MDEFNLCSTPTKKARVEIIPLIDVVFFLLATFVLFILSLQKIASLNVPLPVTGPPQGEDLTVYIQASNPGTYYWKQGRLSTPDLISTSEMSARLADYQRRVRVPRVLVSGDDKAKFGGAVKALDEIRKVGITQISVETNPSSERRVISDK